MPGTTPVTSRTSNVSDHLASRAFPGKEVRLVLRSTYFWVKKTLVGPALKRAEIAPEVWLTYEVATGEAEAERLRNALHALGIFEQERDISEATLRTEAGIDCSPSRCRTGVGTPRRRS
jgi:hypothetical protein